MKTSQKLYTKVKGLRFRTAPSTSDEASIIRELAEGAELTFVDGPWVKVKVGRTEGWVHADYITDISPSGARGEKSLFKIGVPHLSGDETTQKIREEISDEYGGGRNGWELQCTEYVTYRVKTKLGATIEWPVKSGRNGGQWGKIFRKYGTYPVLSKPEERCAMSFTAGVSVNPKINEIGHVAFVEEVYADDSIKISEANWPRNGIYNERVLTKAEWKNKYRADFIRFV